MLHKTIDTVPISLQRIKENKKVPAGKAEIIPRSKPSNQHQINKYRCRDKISHPFVIETKDSIRATEVRVGN